MLKLGAALGLVMLTLGLGACAPSPEPEASAIVIAEGDPARGLLYALDNCAACHAVRAGERQSPNPGAASFDTVANTPGMTYLALDVWLHTPHASMPI